MAVSIVLREMIPKLFDDMKTELITLFAERYVVLVGIGATATVYVATLTRDMEMPY